MPSQPPRVCMKCRKLHPHKEKCPANSRAKEYDAVNAYTGRLSARPWRRLRDQVIFEQDGLCSAPGCLGLIEEVDHIIPRHLRPDLTYERSNLQGLCKPHHDAKTLEEVATYG